MLMLAVLRLPRVLRGQALRIVLRALLDLPARKSDAKLIGRVSQSIEVAAYGEISTLCSLSQSLESTTR